MPVVVLLVALMTSDLRITRAISIRSGGLSTQNEVDRVQHKDVSMPSWQAMVINLDRRPDRLKRFAQAIHEYEPWLASGDHLCRIQGRDGRELPHDQLTTSLQQIEQNDPTILKDWNYNPVGKQTKGSVPGSLLNDDVLLAGNWVDSAALQTAETQNADWPKMTAGGIGLYLGHAAAWQHMVDKNLDYGLIFEDDLTLFASNFEEQVQSILGKTQEEITWDFLYLQRCNDEAWKKKRTSGKDASPVEKQALWSQEVQIPAADVVPCTGAYVLTRQGAKTLLEGALPAKEQMDQQLSYVPGLRRSALTPPVAQCQEIYKNGTWTYRDTDVQQPDEDLDMKQIPVTLQKFLTGGPGPQEDPWKKHLDDVLGLGFVQSQSHATSQVSHLASLNAGNVLDCN